MGFPGLDLIFTDSSRHWWRGLLIMAASLPTGIIIGIAFTIFNYEKITDVWFPAALSWHPVIYISGTTIILSVIFSAFYFGYLRAEPMERRRYG